MGRVIEMVSPLDPDECAARLTEAIDHGDARWVPGSKPVIGSVTGRAVWLRRRIGYRNGFQTILVGTLEEHAAGTRFRGRTGPPRRNRVGLTIWFGGLTLLSVWTCILFLTRGGNPLGLLMAPLMLALGGVIVWLGRWLARDEGAFLSAFAADVLKAREENQAEPWPAPHCQSPASDPAHLQGRKGSQPLP
jgi:hypothetical protein